MSDLNSLIASLDGDVFALLQEGKSLSELLKELLVLRKQNLALQETERRRKAQFSRLCNGCHIIAKDIFLRPPCMADQLPSELVEEIYRFALPPSGYLEPTLGSGPNSLWFRSVCMKKTLTHVIAFAQTLREDTAGLSSLVQKIMIDCYVPKCLWDAVVEDLAFILAVCTSVRSLSFTSAFLRQSSDRIQVQRRGLKHSKFQQHTSLPPIR
ncbi:hypothetical protein A0H81_12451 [Grifola frondosa]|uniref:Uncharacterized protein n=1 Tax=Grifola frondosa TaxID=5627 RepID=A0A1C7LS24_GRIFR|nr:hypothetical protein A0H81_12451 [Grifola frondosa]